MLNNSLTLTSCCSLTSSCDCDCGSSMEEANIMSFPVWSKKDLQVLLVQGIVFTVVVHFLVTQVIPFLNKQLHSLRITNDALNEVKIKKNNHIVDILSLEEEAEKLRLEVIEKSKIVKEISHNVPAEKGFRIHISDECDDEIMGCSAQQVRNEVELDSRINKNGSNVKRKGRKAKASATFTQTPRKSLPQPPYIPQNELIDVSENNDRIETLMEQDIAYEKSLQSDLSRKLLRDAATSELRRLVSEYTDVGEEPEIENPLAITLVFKISDEVYAKRTDNISWNNNTNKKHKKICRRFLLSDKIHKLFSFIFSHIYEFEGHEEKYLGADIPALFCPQLNDDGVCDFCESRYFISFDLICSYPKLVLQSADFFFRDMTDDSIPDQTISDLGLGNKTLLSLRPSG